MQKIILAATPVFKAPGQVPLRYVLVQHTGEYVVWTQSFTENMPHKHDGFCSGHYFQFSNDQQLAFANAYECWMKKATKFQAYINGGNARYSIVETVV